MRIRRLIMLWASLGAKIKRHGRMCDGCAFRKGTKANSSYRTIDDAAQCLAYGQKEFHCHLEDKLCAGFLHAKEYTKSLNREPSQAT